MTLSLAPDDWRPRRCPLELTPRIPGTPFFQRMSTVCTRKKRGWDLRPSLQEPSLCVVNIKDQPLSSFTVGETWGNIHQSHAQGPHGLTPLYLLFPTNAPRYGSLSHPSDAFATQSHFAFSFFLAYIIRHYLSKCNPYFLKSYIIFGQKFFPHKHFFLCFDHSLSIGVH